ncbi:Hypothetical protein CAP_6073 [Chondromyces apiculatus DSM 436]|uniref:Uncharacterized protein n=1 Tax=Chondromyces apiculatus DSM 436 TaxID=1192034 RepID=A0A017THB2_9BACT|nr:Hypothetical protein CAP_6073 [Chondromyces apiculatus DSM 436]
MNGVPQPTPATPPKPGSGHLRDASARFGGDEATLRELH